MQQHNIFVTLKKIIIFCLRAEGKEMLRLIERKDFRKLKDGKKRFLESSKTERNNFKF